MGMHFRHARPTTAPPAWQAPTKAVAQARAIAWERRALRRQIKQLMAYPVQSATRRVAPAALELPKILPSVPPIPLDFSHSGRRRQCQALQREKRMTRPFKE